MVKEEQEQEDLFSILEASKNFQACPEDVREAVRCLLYALNYDWHGEWQADTVYGFCTNLLVNVFGLPETDV